MRQPRVTFGYQPNALCGGKARKPTSLGPRPESRDGLIAPPPAPEGRYLTRERMTNSQWFAQWEIQSAIRKARGLSPSPLL